jgi:uncharacterized protein (DUF488 family)
MQIFTIGHSNHQIEIFLDFLQRYEIEVLVDVRSQPYSAYSSHFNKANLKDALTLAGIKYLFMGKELGGRPDDKTLYDPNGRVNYDKVAETELFKSGLERLKNGMKQYRVVLMCSEENPENCHRHLLLARVLRTQDISVEHIRGDASLQNDSELGQNNDGQMALFDTEGMKSWKSIQSVLPKKPPDNFSKP